MPSRLRGFTLLELVVALTITGMLLTLGMPSFTTFLRNSEVRSTAESISNGLRAARSEATRLNCAGELHPRGGNRRELGDQHLRSGHRSADPAADPAVLALRGRQERAGRAVARERGGDHVQRTGANHLAVADRDAQPAAGRRLLRRRNGEARTLRIYADDIHGVRMCDPDPALKALDAARREGLLT